MIREDLFSFAFIKKSPFYGSYQGMQYRIGKSTDGKELLEVCTYPGPFCFEWTEESLKEYQTFPFTPEGYEQAKEYLEKKGGCA